jgi:hypothetical protein
MQGGEVSAAVHIGNADHNQVWNSIAIVASQVVCHGGSILKLTTPIQYIEHGIGMGGGGIVGG